MDNKATNELVENRNNKIKYLAGELKKQCASLQNDLGHTIFSIDHEEYDNIKQMGVCQSTASYIDNLCGRIYELNESIDAIKAFSK